MEDYQVDCLNEALSRDENGDFKYSIIIWSDIKKSAKSSIAAAVAVWMSQNPWSEIYLVANDLKQADSRVAKYARRAVDNSETLKGDYRTRGYTLLHNTNGSSIEALPIDPEGEAGSNADMIQFSELWGAQDDQKSRMWSELTLSPTKFGQSFRWVESYAGFTDQSEILHDLFTMGVREDQLLWPDKKYAVTGGEPTMLEAYANPEARMFCLWNTQPRCSWQTKEYYASEAAILHPNEFARMHRNQWSANTDTFVPIEWWDACDIKKMGEKWPEIPKNHPHIIALDAAVSDDNFGIVMGCRHPDRKNFPEIVLKVFEQEWKPTGRMKIDFQGTEENPGPELVLRKKIAENNIIQVAYDPYQLHDMATRLRKEGLAWFKAFNQGNKRLEADSMLRDKIRDRTIWHQGEPAMREHLNNADAKIDNEDRKIRIIKRVQKLKIDLAVALSMQVYEVMRLNL